MQSLRAMFSTAPMRALWDDDAIYRAMLRFEAMLAEAQAQCGLIPREAAHVIGQVCAEADGFDWTAISGDARIAGTAAIPFVKALKREVEQRASGCSAFVHYGSTSQDVCETALVMQTRQALALIYAQMQRLGDALAGLVERHRRTPVLARTLMQPAAPVSFGWKAAGWLDALARCALALREAGEAARVLQLGGANGARVALGTHADAVATSLAARLSLASTPLAWHGARDRLARLGNELALSCAMLGKLGRDISLMMQSEVAEVFEPSGEGRGGSSAMPHKRNPVACMHMLDAASRAPALSSSLVADMTAEHERGLGSWPHALPLLADLFMLLDNSVTMAAETIEGLRVEPNAMRANLERLHGVVYSEGASLLLGCEIGTQAAQRIVNELCKRALDEQADFCALLHTHPDVQGKIAAEVIDRACGLDACLDAAAAQCAPILAAWPAQRAALGGEPT
ncbi:adenylosuccinate lyase family protein [Paraburkholderia edwinii]|uniref:Adenylosuccinate lyase family protein n=1 Tax=Paraburkholderia edwinii TaxID=2861782 RepID=A0ABX8UWK2_9BURK|nr:adenylosuccinate lyase family protein [Paraburkholderia edwinii]QYD73256.1 adenylosuccinate lyase family protein [Paraburkholderia edwinii]